MIVRRTIDKDELKELPKVVFPGRIHVIQSESETEKAVAYLLSQPILGIDSDVLSDGQKQYAATDAWACLNIYNLLQELKRTGNYEIAPEEKKEEHLIESDK